MSTHSNTTPVIVQKYGGSSVSSIAGIERVAKRIIETTKQGYKVVAVVSAMGNTTNELLTLAKQISDTPAKRELDLLVSVGERVSMSLLAMALEKLGARAKSFTGSQSGIITTNDHGNSDIVEVKPYRIQRALDEGYIAIVAGFQGMSLQREVTTLGRGGSDTTAVALSAALSAEFCEICSDVSGVYSTDPRLVSEAVLLKELGLHRAIAMAKNGAKVLQVEALQWCQQSGITLVANATANPVGEGTRLEARETKVEDLPVVAFDTQLIAIDEPTAYQIEATQHCVRLHTILNKQEVLIVDIRNLHGEWEKWNHRSVATVTILGSCTPENLGEWTHEFFIQHWWRDTEGVTLLLEREYLSEFVQKIHQQLYTTTSSPETLRI